MVSQGRVYNCGEKKYLERNHQIPQLLGGVNCLLSVVAFAHEKLQEMTVT
jgi:hypothetical protein